MGEIVHRRWSAVSEGSGEAEKRGVGERRGPFSVSPALHFSDSSSILAPAFSTPPSAFRIHHSLVLSFSQIRALNATDNLDRSGDAAKAHADENAALRGGIWHVHDPV